MTVYKKSYQFYFLINQFITKQINNRVGVETCIFKFKRLVTLRNQGYFFIERDSLIEHKTDNNDLPTRTH